LVASESQTAALREKYESGGFGYGHAKQALYELLLERFEEPRKKYEYYINNPQEIDKALEVGAEKARSVANTVLERVRKKIGY
jgi:tryptophanyl-tRNA synthetase